MKYSILFLLLIQCFSYIYTQQFTEESPYMTVRLMDLKTHEWKPGFLDKMEKILDAELKYTDARKGVECKSIDFEQEAGYPKQDARFLDLSIRGLCTDERGKVHDINKELMIVAMERNVDKLKSELGATVYKAGNVQFYKRNRNLLNLIIIPIAVGLTLFLVILTFVLRRIRYAQKRRHIETELEKKRQANAKKAQSVANTDPRAGENQRLLQLDPTVVGNASDTLGSPKEFTNEQHSSPTRTNPSGGNFNREYQGQSPSATSKDNRPLFSNRDRMPMSYENESRVPPPGYSQYELQHPDMIPLQEKQPRVVVKTIRSDEASPKYYQRDESGATFVPIPVQVERSGPHQRFVPPPYHSDPHYRNVNT